MFLGFVFFLFPAISNGQYPVNHANVAQALIECKKKPEIPDACVKIKQTPEQFEILKNSPCKNPGVEFVVKNTDDEFLLDRDAYRSVFVDLKNFNDPLDLNFFASYRRGESKKSKRKLVREITDDEIKAIIQNEVGVLPRDYHEKKWAIAAIEGLAGGRLDFSSLRAGYKSDFFIYNGTLYNDMDFGNFLWAIAMKNLGLNYLAIKAGSEANGFFNTYKQNPHLLLNLKEEQLEQNNKKINVSDAKKICWTGDSEADQKAIRAGYDSNIKVQFKVSDCRTDSKTYSGNFFSVVGHALFGTGMSYEQKVNIESGNRPTAKPTPLPTLIYAPPLPGTPPAP